jgi:hypothetical protein
MELGALYLLLGQLSLLFGGYRRFFSRGLMWDIKLSHSPPPRTELKNYESYTFTAAYVFVARTETTVPPLCSVRLLGRVKQSQSE